MRRLLLPGLATLAVMAVLVGLGVWQLQRLAWKEGLVARIAARARAAPEPLPPLPQWAGLADYDYRHVVARGAFEHEREALVFRASGNGRTGVGGPGYLVLTPLRLADGSRVIVNRGFVPLARKDPASRSAGQPAGEVEVSGLMRPPEPRNAFTPADRPDTGEWYTRDPAAIAAHLRIAAAPFTIDADAAPAPPGGLPQGGATVLAIPNDHLSYALTWFGLALALAGVFAAFARGRVRAGERGAV